MIARLCGSIVLCLLLAGCVLQSPKPLFSDAQASLLPASFGTRFMLENLDQGKWVSENDVISLKASGKHYVAHNGKKKETIEALFVNLGNNWWLLQANEPNKPSTYIMAQSTGGALMLQPLMCDDLKGRAGIAFKGGDCTIEGNPSQTFFQQFTKTPPSKMRLRPVK